MVKIAEQAPIFNHTDLSNHTSITAEADEIAEGGVSETAEADSFTKSPLAETKDSLLGYLSKLMTFGFIGGWAARTQTGQKAVMAATTAVKATKTAAKVAHIAQAAKNIKLLKNVFTWVSRGIKGIGVCAAPFTGGGSIAVGLAAGLALDLVAGEAIDAGITYANGGQILDENKNDWIKLGDWAGQGLHQCFA